MALVGRALGRTRTRAEEARRRRARIRHQAEGDRRPPVRGATRPRRRRTLSLPVEMGAEVSLPALPSIRFGPRATSAVLLALWSLTVYGAWTSGRFEVGQVAIEGAKLLTEAQIRSIARLRDLPSFAVDPQAVKERLESHAEIDAAEVRVRWPATVMIRVQERRPILEWKDGPRVWWLNAAGVAFIQREPVPGLVRVVSEEPVLQIDDNALLPAVAPQVLWEAVSLAERMPHLGDLTYSRTHGLGFEDPRGWYVVVGQGGDLEAKLRLYEALAAVLEEREERVELISVEDLSSPYYKLTR